MRIRDDFANLIDLSGDFSGPLALQMQDADGMDQYTAQPGDMFHAGEANEDEISRFMRGII